MTLLSIIVPLRSIAGRNVSLGTKALRVPPARTGAFPLGTRACYLFLELPALCLFLALQRVDHLPEELVALSLGGGCQLRPRLY
jgi:hypothetical protein